MIRLAFILIVSVLIATPAQARWRMASSENFVIYADETSRNLERYSIILERYHAAMERLTGRTVAPPSPSSRLTVFVLESQRSVSRLAGSREVAGFYIPSASGSLAFVQDLRMNSAEPTWSMTVL